MSNVLSNLSADDKELILLASLDEDEAIYMAQRHMEEEIPVAYLTERCFFAGRIFRSDPRALVPRRETETLLTAGIECSREDDVIIDVGTGSGNVAISLKLSDPTLDVIGVDISSEALDLAMENASIFETSIDFMIGDLLKNIPSEIEPQVILANLPYLRKSTADEYSKEMTLHEPEVALWGGDDGLDLVRRLVDEASKLSSVRAVALECGKDQDEEFFEVMRYYFPIVYGIKDDNEDVRTAVGKRKP